MNPTINQRKAGRILRIKRHPVKLTALLCLKEALLTERYEECREYIAVAKEFGAKSFEIRYLLENPQRLPT